MKHIELLRRRIVCLQSQVRALARRVGELIVERDRHSCTAVELFRQREELIKVLTRFRDAAQSWHDFHKHDPGIQCDALCDCIPRATAVLLKGKQQP